MNISITAELENFVNAKIESGRYTSPTEVVTEALHLLEKQDQVRDAQLTAFNQELGRRLESLDCGVNVSPNEVRGRLFQKSEQRRQALA